MASRPVGPWGANRFAIVEALKRFRTTLIVEIIVQMIRPVLFIKITKVINATWPTTEVDGGRAGYHTAITTNKNI